MARAEVRNLITFNISIPVKSSVTFLQKVLGFSQQAFKLLDGHSSF